MPVLAVAAGAGLGVGLLLVWRALRPPPAPLFEVMSRLETLAPTTRLDGDQDRVERISTGVYGWATRRGLVDEDTLANRLRLLDRTPERHVFAKLAYGTFGLLVPLTLVGLAAAMELPVPAGMGVVVGVVLAAAGFVVPDLGINDRVEHRRRGFRHALSAYLDLVTVILAGGGGLETALHAAAESGDGWAFAELRHALRRARLTGITPWESFDQLGRELGVDELRDLAASAYLAGDQGARIRASLTAKADSMRSNQTAAVEAEAEAATERMLLPVMALVLGMILFIGYGAVEAISTPAVTP